MNLADLFTSAGINIGFAILFLSLYSVFSKQPGNAGVYFTRDLLRERENKHPGKERRTLESFVPSVGWLIRAWRATEDDILKSAGLDAVVFLRIFVFRYAFTLLARRAPFSRSRTLTILPVSSTPF